MLWNILKCELSGMPASFESNSAKDAENIMQAWADKRKSSRGMSVFGKLDFKWVNWNGIDTCVATFARKGQRNTFMKIAKC